jgi:hypothetical protein
MSRGNAAQGPLSRVTQTITKREDKDKGGTYGDRKPSSLKISLAMYLKLAIMAAPQLNQQSRV